LFDKYDLAGGFKIRPLYLVKQKEKIMTKLNNKLINLLQDENNKIFDVVNDIKEKLLKIYNSDIVRPKDKNMVLKKYSAFSILI